MLEDDTSRGKPAKLIVSSSPALPSKTFRLKLATSLQVQAERVAQIQGVSVSYFITKAIEEKIARFKNNQRVCSDRNRVHLVSDV